MEDDPSSAASGSATPSTTPSSPRARFADANDEDDSQPSASSSTATVERPKNRPRGISLPAFQHSALGPGLLSYLPTGYGLQSLQALDLDLPTLPSHLTYTSLRSSLLAHINELERKLLTYYGDATGATSDNEEVIEDESDDPFVEGKGKGKEKERSPTPKDMSPTPSPSPPTSSSYFPSRPRRSTSTNTITPDLLLSQLSLLRAEVLTYLPTLSTLSSQMPSLPRLPSTSNLNLPNRAMFSPSSSLPPAIDFLSSLPGRLDHLHHSVKKIPSSLSSAASVSQHFPFPEFSLEPNTKLGMGAQQVFDLLDAILPKEEEGQEGGMSGGRGERENEESEGGSFDFPIFPNRTPRHWRSFERRRTFTLPRPSHSRRTTTTSSTGEGETTDDDDDEDADELLTGGLMRVISREIGEYGKEVVEVMEEVEEGPTVESAVKKAREREAPDGKGDGLIEFVDLPGMWQNNEFIVGGYRFIPIEDWQKLVRSLFAIHNETVNIHSHLLTSILVLLSIPYFLYSTPFHSTVPPATFDTVVLLFFLLAAFKCLFCSSLWHLFAGCATKRYFVTFACVDYLGISWLIAASVNSVVYFGFYNHPTPLAVYGLLNLTVGVAGSILPFQRWFNQRHNKHLRILFFLGMAFSALAPIAHMVLLNSLVRTLAFLSPVAPSLGCYFFGLWFYAHHYPESRWPGMFDKIGASHNIWHASIVCAIAFHLRGVLELYRQKELYSPASARIFNPARWGG